MAKNWINLIIAYDHITINNHTKESIKIDFARFASCQVIEAKAKNNQLIIMAIIITVHNIAVVVARVISWKNHNTVGFWFDFLIHKTLYIFKLHCQLSRQSVLIFIQTSDKDVSQWPLSSSTPGQHQVHQPGNLYIFAGSHRQVLLFHVLPVFHVLLVFQPDGLLHQPLHWIHCSGVQIHAGGADWVSHGWHVLVHHIWTQKTLQLKKTSPTKNITINIFFIAIITK